MKIELIQPPAKGLKDQKAYPPLGLMYLASNIGYNPQVANEDTSIKIICDESEFINIDMKADIFGINIHAISTFQSSMAVIRFVKTFRSDAIIVVGGAFVNKYTQSLIEKASNNQINHYIYGEGEISFSNLIYNIKQGYNSNTIYEYAPLIDNLDVLLFPKRDLLPIDVIRHEGKVHHSDTAATTILASRGCPYKCGFCDKNLWGRSIRYRSVNNVIKEIEHCIEKYGIKWFRFPDDNLLISKAWIDEFTTKVKKYNISYTMLASPKDVLKNDILKLNVSGCKEIFMGIESGSDEMLRKMGKNHTAQDNADAIWELNECMVKSCAYILFGYPGECEKTIDETIKWLETAKPDKARLHIFIPFPGLDMWENPDKYKMKIDKQNYDYWDFIDFPDISYEYENVSKKELLRLKMKLAMAMKEMGYLDGWTK